VLGRLDPDRFLGGRMSLDRNAAVTVVQKLADELGLGLEETAEGILTIANSNMARAIRSRTIEKGHDPREFALVAFGGAGPLHAADVADSLEIPEVLVPPYPGITSAGGLLTSDLKYDRMRTVFQLEGSIDGDRLNRELDELAGELRGWLQRDGVDDADIEVIRALDCRYVGQGYELRVTLEGPFDDAALAQFHRLHEREYGSAYGDPIEIVNARVTAIGKRPTLDELPVASGRLVGALVGEGEGHFRVDGKLQAVATRFYDRDKLPLDESIEGPAVVFHLDTTTVVPPTWSARADASGNLIMTKGGAQ
jgi:N-methylhydantoinase A/oxoprolinase/acetone carboxylase beta subunit